MNTVQAVTASAKNGGHKAVLGVHQSFLEANSAAVYICAANGVITRNNPPAAKLWRRMPRIGNTDERFCGADRWSAVAP